MGLEFGLLGDVEVRADGEPVDVGHARQRCVLVVLLVGANRAVSAGQLVERVWGQRAPHRARETLRNYLSRLRHTLDPLPDVDLARQPGGYVLTVDPLAVDVHRFEHLVSQARAATDEDQTLVLFEQALGLWRGEPFTGLDTPWVNALRNTLERDRFAVELDCADLQLRRGQHGRLLSELTDRAGAHPLDERVAGQLMLALYRCGRQAEVLDHFQQLRARLADELGIDPGPGLHRLYEQILTTDPALATDPAIPAALASAPAVPRHLPAHTPHFVGREAELRQLSTLLDTTTPGGGTVVITAIGGTAGIGKTALALHWAHHAADRFPDGQLYVNLRGFDPTNTPVHPADALRGFLDAFQIPPQQIPAGMDAQAGLYRGLLTNRHVLIVLDNARDADQVRPLLPASPTCLVVITSRNQLTGLIAQEGARPVTLDVLSTQEARALLAGHLGTDRVNADPDAITDLIEHCARLPLALAIVAARASTHPGFALRVLAKELADEHTRLDALDTGEPTTSVRAVFSWSYQHLSGGAAQMFRLLGLHPGPDIALPAATQLADLSPPQAREALGELTRAHLLTQHTPGRYTFHDLLRAYATHLTTAHDSPDDPHAALTRLFDHYLHTATAAMDTLYPDHPHRSKITPPTLPTPPVVDPAAARAWLDTEWDSIIAIIAHTATHGWHTHTTRLTNTVLVRVRWRDAPAVYTHLQRAARAIRDHETEAIALTNLGLLHWQQGRCQQATDHHQQAIELCHEIGFPYGEVIALTNLGIVDSQQGRYQQAADQHQHALTLCREIGFPFGEAYVACHLGLLHWRQGRYQQAADHHQHAVTFCHEIGFPAGEAVALSNLGLIRWKQGRYQQATDHHRQANAICHAIGFPVGEVFALSNLGIVYSQQGRYQQAADHIQQALALCREIGYPAGEAFALSNLGLVRWKQGRYQQAADHLQNALTLCHEIGFPASEALALTYLGTVYQRQGCYWEAAEHQQQALTLCRETGDRANEAPVLNSLAETHHVSGHSDKARTQHTAALTLATELGDRYEQARAHHGLARIHHTTGNLDQARHHCQQALTLYADLGVPEAADIRAHLTALD